MKRIIVTSGYMESGSSALTDLLMEFDGFSAPNQSFEYVFMHCPDGLFDLEDKLLLGNNALRSDEAIRSFRNMMNKLYSYSEKKYWIAGYKKNVSEQFMQYVEEFIHSIGTIKHDTYWYRQEEPTCKTELLSVVRKMIKALSLRTIDIGKPLKYKEMELSFPDEEIFYSAAKTFILKIIHDINKEHSDYPILDQMMLPHNLYRLPRYFSQDEIFCFVIDRDPRDVYISNMHYLKGIPVPYPKDVEQFCRYYRQIRESEKIVDYPNVARIHFEDLIYHHDETIQLIKKLLDLPDVCIHERTSFDPDISIKNTMLFVRNPGYNSEAKYIKDHLSEYCYDFNIL